MRRGWHDYQSKTAFEKAISLSALSAVLIRQKPPLLHPQRKQEQGPFHGKVYLIDLANTNTNFRPGSHERKPDRVECNIPR